MIINKKFIFDKNHFILEYMGKKLSNIYITSHQREYNNIYIGGYLLYGISILYDAIKMSFLLKCDIDGNIDEDFKIIYGGKFIDIDLIEDKYDLSIKKICCDYNLIYVHYISKDSQGIKIYSNNGELLNTIEDDLFEENSTERDILDIIIANTNLIILLRQKEGINNKLCIVVYNIKKEIHNEYCLDFIQNHFSSTLLNYDISSDEIYLCVSIKAKLTNKSQIFSFKNTSLDKVINFTINNCQINYIFKDNFGNFLLNDIIQSKIIFYKPDKYGIYCHNKLIYIDTYNENVRQIFQKNRKLIIYFTNKCYIFNNYAIMVRTKHPNICIDLDVLVNGLLKEYSYYNKNLIISCKSFKLFDSNYIFYLLDDLSNLIIKPKNNINNRSKKY
jgi:hypothetical protein